MIMELSWWIGLTKNKEQEYSCHTLNLSKPVQSIMKDNTGQLQIDLLFDVLSDGHRRQLVAYMHTSNKDIFHLDDLAQIIDIQESDPSEFAEKNREQVTIGLHHRHLPKIADAGLIEFDSRHGDVRYRGPTDSEIIDVSQFLNSTDRTVDNIDQ